MACRRGSLNSLTREGLDSYAKISHGVPMGFAEWPRSRGLRFVREGRRLRSIDSAQLKKGGGCLLGAFFY